MKPYAHIIPVDDYYDHAESVRCPCKPTVKLGIDGRLIVVHNAFDRRELFEPDKELSLLEHLERLLYLPGMAANYLYYRYLKWQLNQIWKKSTKPRQ